MIVDSTAIPARQEFKADLCIVGAGPVGITVAKEFAGTPYRVILIESGGSEPSPSAQAVFQGVSDGQPYYDLAACRTRSFGGTSNVWGGWCRPLDPIDFEPREWVPNSGWPLKYSDLEPYYGRAHSVCGLSEPNYDVHSWRPTQHTSLISADKSAFDEMVFHMAPLRFGETYGKQVKVAQNIEVLLNGSLLELKTSSELNTVQYAEVSTVAGNKFYVAARAFVIAAGGIENARILLCSERSTAGGIGNSSGLVGRFFSDHLHTYIGVLAPERSGVSVFYQKQSVRGAAIRGGLCLSEKLRRQERLLGFGVTLHNADDPHDVVRPPEKVSGYLALRYLLKSVARGRQPEEIGKHVSRVVAEPKDTLKKVYTKLIKPKRRRLLLGCRSEQSPNSLSRVQLDTSRDQFGVPRVRLTWKVAQEDFESLRSAGNMFCEELRGRGFRIDPWRHQHTGDVIAAAHHIGTTRMHHDPKQGVVDEHCRVHGVDNLYVAGSSVFTTAGWATPTLTAITLALRLADRLRIFLSR